jgi:hypothetical protein
MSFDREVTKKSPLAVGNAKQVLNAALEEGTTRSFGPDSMTAKCFSSDASTANAAVFQLCHHARTARTARARTKAESQGASPLFEIKEHA